MNYFKKVFNKNKIRKYKRTFNKYKRYILENLVDILVIIAMFIIGINSAIINLQFGMYVIALEFIALAYFLSKKNSNVT